MTEPTPDELERLTGNVQEEILAQNALQDLGLSKEQVAELARWIAINIDYAFEVRWAPGGRAPRAAIQTDPLPRPAGRGLKWSNRDCTNEV